MIDKIERAGITYYRFQVTSDGTKGHVWIKRLRNKGISTTRASREFLTSDFFVETNGVITEVVIPEALFLDDPRQEIPIEEIWAWAGTNNLKSLSAECICLILMRLAEADLLQMGVKWIIGMSKLVGLPPRLLAAGRHHDGPPRLAIFDANPKSWLRPLTDGFAFAVPPVTTAT
jgi:hypothetical protein